MKDSGGNQVLQGHYGANTAEGYPITINRGSYMNASVLLNFIKRVEEKR